MLRRSFWGLSDQAVSSVSSLVFAIMVARVSSPEEVGGWAVAYAVFTVVLTVARSVFSTTALIALEENSSNGAVTGTDRGAVSLSSSFGLVSGIILVFLGVFISGPTGIFLVLFGLGMPVLLYHDSLRYVFIRQGRPQYTTAMDVVWLILQIVLAILLQGVLDGGVAVVVAWLLGVLASGLFARVIVGGVLSGKAVVDFIRTHSRTSGKLLVDSMLRAGTANGLPLLLGATLGLVATGYFRGALTLLGVAGIVVMGLSPLATVELRHRTRDPRFLNRFLIVWSVMLGCIGAALFVVFAMMPDSMGQEFLGETWFGARELLFAMSVQVVLRGPFTGVPIVLRAARRLNSLILMRFVQSVLTLVTTMACALIWGLGGAAWGWAFAGGVSSAWALLVYRKYIFSVA